uniref:Uncharacterized protein n=1 Tax=Glossina palpalis gambiensis TaxID=67801 RepID=A0A1B0BH73_9MUSC
MSFNTRNANNIRDDCASNNITGGNGSDRINGILRKVYGSTAVFRGDGKALDIDQGKHIIPWMGYHNPKMDSIVDVLLKKQKTITTHDHKDFEESSSAD